VQNPLLEFHVASFIYQIKWKSLATNAVLPYSLRQAFFHESGFVETLLTAGSWKPDDM
jgi:hypothetical protein